MEHLQAYRKPIEESLANTAHNFNLSFATVKSSIYSILLNYLYYLFGPIINFKFTIEHTVLFWEAAIRAVGIFLMISTLVKETNKKTHLLLIVYYFTMTLLWSLGTTNDGQAFRHHFLSQWIICIYIALKYCQIPQLKESNKLA